MYKLRRAKQAQRDYETATKNGFTDKLAEIFDVVERDPYENTPGHHYEELKGNLKGRHSRRLNRHNRFIYEVLPNDEALKDKDGNPYDGIVRILTMWGHHY